MSHFCLNLGQTAEMFANIWLSSIGLIDVKSIFKIKSHQLVEESASEK